MSSMQVRGKVRNIVLSIRAQAVEYRVREHFMRELDIEVSTPRYSNGSTKIMGC